jgi:hypothetical protein
MVALAAGVPKALHRADRHGGDDQQSPAAALTIAAARSFDPQTSDDNKDENPRLVPLAIDGDPKTFWATAKYRQAHFAGLKDGVGLILSLDQPTTISRLTLATNTEGWSAEVYVSDDDFGDDPAGWGRAVATIPAGGKAQDVPLTQPTRGSRVLLWLTDTGQSSAGYRFELDEVTLH